MSVNTPSSGLLVAVAALSTLLAASPAVAETCNGGADQATNFRFVQAPGSLVPGVAARVVVAVDNPGPTTWRGEGSLPHPYRLGVGSDLEPAGDVTWGIGSCGGYSNSLKDQRVYLCPGPGQTIAEVPPGGSAQFSFDITAPPGSSGNVAFRVRMVFDAGTECDGWFEVQHTALFPVVVPTQLPDLVVDGIDFSTPPTGSQPTRATARLRNGGQAASGPFNVRWLVDGQQIAAGGHVSLDPGQTSTGNVNFDWTPPPSGVHTLRFEADFDGHVEETNEGNNGFDVTVDLGGAPLPDLVVDGITFSTPPTADQPTQATAHLRNGGAAASGSFNVRWLVNGSEVAAGGHTSLDPGQTSTGNVNFTWTPTSGVQTLRFEADYDGHVPETDEGNNGAQVTVDLGGGQLLPDLVVDEITFSIPPAAGQTTTATARLRNDGQAASGPFSVRWLVDGSEIAVGGHDSLDPGQTSTGNVHFDWAAPTSGGVHTLRFEADFDAHVDESNEGNNGAQVTVDLGGGQPLPDLVVEGITFSTPPAVGQTTRATARLRNAGAAPSGSFSVRWVINGSEIAAGGHDSLDPGQVSSGNVSFDWTPTTDGVSTVRFEADYLGQVPESNELNNAFQVVVSPGQGQPEVRVEVVDPAGSVVPSGATLAPNAEGWPSPNGLTVRVILTCPAGGALGCRGFQLKLVESSEGSPARFYMQGIAADACAVDGPESRSPSFFSFEQLTWRCHDGASIGMELQPGETRVLTFALMAQPREQGTLGLTATWRDASASHALAVDRASIHPLIVIPGILGTMPPSPIIGQMDPVLGVYAPLLAQLQKMGYVDGSTLLPMPYDWRRSNHESAGVLKETIDRILAGVAGLPNVNPDGKVDLIVHSMGGLITRTYVQNQAVDSAGSPIPYGNEVRKVVFTSTPHRGFPEDYRTYEGVTWDMFLYDDPVPLFAMENVFWPSFIEKRWRKRHTAYVDYFPFPQGHPFADRVMCLFSPLDCSGMFSHTLKYRMMHDAVGGTDSMREMLPTKDSDAFWPYLCNGGAGGLCGGPYPFGQQLNPLLDGPGGLNASVLDFARNLDPVPGRRDPVQGAKNIYVVFGRDPGRAIDQTDAFYVVNPPVVAAGTLTWQNGAPAQNFVTNAGDDLIPDYSMNLKLLLPDIPAANVKDLPGPSARHIHIMSDPAYLATHIPGFLAGLAPLPFTSPYVKPPFLLNPPQWWTLAALCPVNLTMTDPQGRRLGFDAATGGTFQEIPNAFYAAPGSPDGQFLVLSDPVPGTYEVTASGFDADSFSLFLSQVTRTGVFRRWTTGGRTEPGQVDHFTVEIDTTLPAVQHPPVASAGPDQVVKAGADCVAAVTLDGTGSRDEDGEDLTYIWTGPFGATAGSRVTVSLPVGVHALTLLVQDGQHSSTDTVTVTVRDATPPVIRKIEAEPDVIAAHEHGLREVTVEVDASDTCGSASCRITGVTADETIDGSDWKITGPLTVKLRAERSSHGDGRTYRIAVACNDSSGNSATRTVTVFVPPSGRLDGEGRLEAGGKRYDYELDVREDADGRDHGELELKIRSLAARKDHDDDDHDDDDDDDDDHDGDHDHGGEQRFEATEFRSITFRDDPSLDPGKPRAIADTVDVSGKGEWNGHSGYRFETRATDAGEPGPGRDRFRITIWNGKNKVVAKVDGVIIKGNNQAR